ncbi:MAG TPA: ABC transporter permease subunit [Fimbriimonadaceae bacterium]|nr:ABC transporter permease subunit [Fimbriimonadaceae bacterium]
MSATSPIADLTYRDYDGPMNSADHRWWAIAKMMMRMAIARKGFWACALLSGWFYVVMMVVFYFVDVAQSSVGPAQINYFKTVNWKDQFVTGMSTAQLFLFIVALIIGIGTIANDNRANALLIYLSKPCTKLDYLIGKWVGIFIPIYCVALVPGLVFWAYIAMSFREYGSVSSAPWVPLQLFVISLFPACILASLCVGVSSLFNQGRTAGFTLFGIYFIANIFTKMMQGMHFVAPDNRFITDLFYSSIDGLSFGLSKLAMFTDGSLPMVQKAQAGAEIGRPDAWFMFPAFIAVCALSVWIAWIRIRPVEVVG